MKTLFEECVAFFNFFDGVIGFGIGAGGVGPKEDQVFVFLVSGENAAEFVGGLEMAFFDGFQSSHDAAEGGQDIDRGPMVFGTESAVEDDVSVQDPAHFVGDRFFHIAPCDEDGVEGGDGAFVVVAGAFE